jgi:tRNA pseudouridine38-40 synthase
MRNIKLTLAYDGSNYHGFQEQRGSGLPTIQETLEWSLGKLAGRRIQVIGAGRTDAGVHARGQVVNFDAAGWSIPAGRIPLALNGILPDDIVALEAVSVRPEFHARFAALAKTYLYVVYNNRLPCPFRRRYAYFVPRQLDCRAMEQAARYLAGTFDFKSFQAAGTPVKSTVRTMYMVRVEQLEDTIHFTFRGNGFLYNQVRIMVGTLLQVGRGKTSVSAVSDILAARDRTLAGPTVPPQGLYLEQVEYPPGLESGRK